MTDQPNLPGAAPGSGDPMAAIGGLGIFLIRIYKDVRGRPAYVVKSTVGIVADDRSS